MRKFWGDYSWGGKDWKFATPTQTPIAVIAGTGKATDFKFGAFTEQKPVKISGKVAVGVLRNFRDFSGHPYIGRMVRSSLR